VQIEEPGSTQRTHYRSSRMTELGTYSAPLIRVAEKDNGILLRS
jgi:hypothetical protein